MRKSRGRPGPAHSAESGSGVPTQSAELDGVRVAIVGSRNGLGASWLTTTLGTLAESEYELRSVALRIPSVSGTQALSPTPAAIDARSSVTELSSEAQEWLHSCAKEPSPPGPSSVTVPPQHFLEGAAFLNEALRVLGGKFHLVFIEASRQCLDLLEQGISQTDYKLILTEVDASEFTDTSQTIQRLAAMGEQGLRGAILVGSHLQPCTRNCSMLSEDFQVDGMPMLFALPYSPQGSSNARSLLAHREGKLIRLRGISDPVTPIDAPLDRGHRTPGYISVVTRILRLILGELPARPNSPEGQAAAMALGKRIRRP